MSTTEQEALAPQTELDAPVTAPPSEPDGKPEGAADEADPSPAAKTDTSDSPEPAVKGVQKRIDELTKNWRETERRERESARDAAYWREQALRLQSQPIPQPQQRAPEPEAEKTLADFGFDEAKYRSYERSRISQESVELAKQALKAEREQQTIQELNANYVKRAREFARENPEYKDYAETAPISEGVADIIKRLDNGPEIALYLGKNPEIAIEVSNLSQIRSAIELGKIAAKLEFQRASVAKAKTLVSSAPQPTPKIEGSEPAITPKASSPDSDSMTMDQWLKQRNKEVKPRKR
jgi:hypothetical protein